MSWKKVKLGDVLIKKNLKFKDVPNLKDPIVLGVTNTDGVVKSKVDAGEKIENYYVVEKGDFVYNPYRINVGSIGISDFYGITSLAYVVFNVDEKHINKFLLYKFLKSEFGIKEIKRNGRGSVRNALRFEDLAKIELMLPSIEEQNSFIEKFKQKEAIIDLLKNNYSHQLTLIEQLNQAILQEAVQGKLVPQDPNDEPASELLKRIKMTRVGFQPDPNEKIGLKPNPSAINRAGFKPRPMKELPPIKPEEIPFDIPDNWVWCRLSEIVRITGGGTPSMLNLAYWNGDIPWVSPKDMKSEFIYDSEMKITEKAVRETTANLIPQGSILIVGRSGILKRKVPVAINKIDCAVNQDMKVYIPTLFEMNRYLQFMFLGLEEIILKRFVKFGMTVHSLKYEEFANMPIPLPPLAEQKRIVAEIERQFAKTKQLKELVLANQAATEQLLKALLHEAFEVKEKD
ncbi:MAG TPA: restriction endonuclease subunit S [Bacteroidia bacterium]|nr:restriction endonuclease subunit S [Bacteroidia bacterium]HRU69374.1 restriction endonuclease subunit S [Bacteroidia bacterium]